MTHAERTTAPAAERNKQPILDVLRAVLPPDGSALEVASGTGQHVAHFAAALPAWTWLPSDRSDDAFGSIAAWTEGLPNVLPPVVLDAAASRWPVGTVDLVFNANMIHIAPWAVALGLLAGAGRQLRDHGLLVMYGPYRIGGRHTAPSNEAFDADLRARDPSWGVRELDDVVAVATREGLHLDRRIAMPANNQVLVFVRAARPAAPDPRRPGR